MADLEEFLRQAAERRKQRQSGVPPTQSNAPQSEVPQLRPLASGSGSAGQNHNAQRTLQPRTTKYDEIEVIEAEVIEPESVVNHGVHLRSNIPQRQHLAEQIGQADERMLGHVKNVFEHRVGHLPNSPAKQGQLRASRESMTNEETAVVRGPENQIGKDLLKMLSQPQALKLAFIASEIFKRKF